MQNMPLETFLQSLHICNPCNDDSHISLISNRIHIFAVLHDLDPPRPCSWSWIRLDLHQWLDLDSDSIEAILTTAPLFTPSSPRPWPLWGAMSLLNVLFAVCGVPVKPKPLSNACFRPGPHGARVHTPAETCSLRYLQASQDLIDPRLFPLKRQRVRRVPQANWACSFCLWHLLTGIFTNIFPLVCWKALFSPPFQWRSVLMHIMYSVLHPCVKRMWPALWDLAMGCGLGWGGGGVVLLEDRGPLKCQPEFLIERQPHWSIRDLLIHYSQWARPIALSLGPTHAVINAAIDYQASSAFVWLVKSMPF